MNAHRSLLVHSVLVVPETYVFTSVTYLFIFIDFRASEWAARGMLR